jgi:hypothetical protein
MTPDQLHAARMRVRDDVRQIADSERYAVPPKPYKDGPLPPHNLNLGGYKPKYDGRFGYSLPPCKWYPHNGHI